MKIKEIHAIKQFRSLRQKYYLLGFHQKEIEDLLKKAYMQGKHENNIGE